MLKNLILYPEDAREVASHTVTRVEAAPAAEAYLRPVLLPDGTLARTPARAVRGVLVLGDPSPLGGPRLVPGMPDPVCWVSHAVEVAVEVCGHVLLRREGWIPEDLAAAGLGLLRRDPSGGWTDEGRTDLRRWLFDPRRDEADVLAVLHYAAASGVWCIYTDEDN